MFVWRRLREGELNHELIWLCVSLACAGLALLWMQLGLRHPACVFHDLTGFACPSCGATRCVRFAAHGDWTGAFLINPLVFTSFAALALYDLYAAVVLALRLPRLRISALSARTGWIVRGAVLALFVANWIWLIARGV